MTLGEADEEYLDGDGEGTFDGRPEGMEVLSFVVTTVGAIEGDTGTAVGILLTGEVVTLMVDMAVGAGEVVVMGTLVWGEVEIDAVGKVEGDFIAKEVGEREGIFAFDNGEVVGALNVAVG